MVPKAFPFPIGVGTDICQIHRIAAILRRRETRERWARKVFTRLEWPSLWRAFQRCQLSTTDRRGNSPSKHPQAFFRTYVSEHVEGRWNDDNVISIGTVEPAAFRKHTTSAPVSRAKGVVEQDSAIWLLPNLSRFSKILDDPDIHKFSTAISNEQSPLGILARTLAGRWAAKEAVIKAHSHRRLYMQDISILVPRQNPHMWPVALAKRQKPLALIEPPCKTILMNEKVAEIRALRGFGPRSQGLLKSAVSAKSESDKLAQKLPRDREKQEGYYERRSKVEESDRQIAEISLSHDGNNAIAVCMALDEPSKPREPERVVDDGKWLPIHEPQWGDEGWFAKEKYDPMDDDDFGYEEGKGVSKDVKKAVDDFFTSEGQGIPFLPR